MLENFFNVWVWLLITFGPLLILQRSLHRHIQAIFLLSTRRLDVTIVLFSVLFFPGVLLHEASHFLMARLLGVKTGRFSIIPRPLSNGRVQLGFVETVRSDWLRDALIGAAPLLAGGAFVAYAGLTRLGFGLLWQQVDAGGFSALASALSRTANSPDFWIWFYLAFAVSSTMLPSSSDRRTWLPLALFFVLLFGLGLLFGAGPWLLEATAEPLQRGLRAAVIVFAISSVLHLVLLLPTWLLHLLLGKLTGMEVVG